MSWVLHDFECCKCTVVWEDLVDSHADHTSECPKCGELCPKIFSAANIAGFSLMDADSKRQALMKRSYNHTAKEVSKNPEKWGEAGISHYNSTKPIKG